jgi:hypothetical protein
MRCLKIIALAIIVRCLVGAVNAEKIYDVSRDRAMLILGLYG